MIRRVGVQRSGAWGFALGSFTLLGWDFYIIHRARCDSTSSSPHVSAASWPFIWTTYICCWHGYWHLCIWRVLDYDAGLIEITWSFLMHTAYTCCWAGCIPFQLFFTRVLTSYCMLGTALRRWNFMSDNRRWRCPSLSPVGSRLSFSFETVSFPIPPLTGRYNFHIT